jgi:hypothetical protein
VLVTLASPFAVGRRFDGRRRGRLQIVVVLGVEIEQFLRIERRLFGFVGSSLSLSHRSSL